MERRGRHEHRSTIDAHASGLPTGLQERALVNAKQGIDLWRDAARTDKTGPWL